MNILYVIHVVYRVNQAEYGIPILVVAPQEYVNMYSTGRFLTVDGGGKRPVGLTAVKLALTRNPFRVNPDQSAKCMLTGRVPPCAVRTC